MTNQHDFPEFKCLLTNELRAHCKEQDVDPNDFLPARAEDLSSGWDVRCAEPDGVTLNPGCYFKIPLGIKIFAPSGWWLKLVPRSSTFIKRNIHSLYGTIDEAFEGEIHFCGQYVQDACDIINVNHLKRVEFGDRIGQLIPIRRETMTISSISEEEFSNLVKERNGSRGEGGFGSTGSI